MENYIVAKTEKEALEALKKYKGKARIMAGGTDMLLDMQTGKIATDCVVDVSRVEALCQITEVGNTIKIGGSATHNTIAESKLIQAYGKALADASGVVGSYQIRNSSTLAGNVINAQPAADSAVALLALGGIAEITDDNGIKQVDASQLYAGVGKSTVDSTASLVTGFYFNKKTKGQGSGFARLQQRKALALPMLNVGVFIEVDAQQVKAVRIVMAPVGPGPVRAKAAEEFLIGKAANAENFAAAAKLALEDANPRDSIVRGSKAYRLGVLPSLVLKGLTQAYEDSKLDVGEVG